MPFLRANRRDAKCFELVEALGERGDVPSSDTFSMRESVESRWITQRGRRSYAWENEPRYNFTQTGSSEHACAWCAGTQVRVCVCMRALAATRGDCVRDSTSRINCERSHVILHHVAGLPTTFIL